MSAAFFAGRLSVASRRKQTHIPGWAPSANEFHLLATNKMNRIHSAHQASCCVHRGWIRTADGMELRAGSTIMESGSPLLVASRVSDADAPNGSSIAICAIWRDQRSTGQRHFNIICNIGLVARASVLVALRGPSPLSFRLSFWGGWGGTRVLPPAPPPILVEDPGISKSQPRAPDSSGTLDDVSPAMEPASPFPLHLPVDCGRVRAES